MSLFLLNRTAFIHSFIQDYILKNVIHSFENVYCVFAYFQGTMVCWGKEGIQKAKDKGANSIQVA